MNLKLFIAGLAGITLSGAAFAQAGGSAAAAGAANATKGPEMSSGFGKDANFDRTLAQQHGGMYFSGKVAVDGGTLPWDPIPVIVDCSGVVKYNTRTDAKGSFAIQDSGRIRTSSELVPQAGAPKQLTAADLIGCQVKASLAGFRSSAITIANGNLSDDPNIGTITLHLDEHALGYGVSATTAAAPPDALKKFEKARSEAMNNNPDGAQHDLQKAVQIDPKFAEAWYQLGKLQQQSKPEDALASFEKAIAADPQFVSPYQPMAELAASQKKWQEAADATDSYLKLDPKGTAPIWYLNAVGKFNTGNKDAAEASARKALAMDPRHTQVQNTEPFLAIILASKGELEECLDHLRNSLTYIPSGPSADAIKQNIAKVEQALVSAK